jgi:hypothetical protein
VSEGAGTVALTIINKQKKKGVIGCRTIETEGDQKGNAKAGHDYELYD